MLKQQRFVRFFVLLILGLFLHGPAYGAEAPFYQGKTVTVIQGAGDPGGTADLHTKPVIQYLQKNLAGHPAFVFQYMSGGGGIAAGNHLAQSVRRDGLTLGVMTSSSFGQAILGASGVRYKLDDFIFFGSPTSGGPYTLVIRPELGVDTVEKLRSAKGPARVAQGAPGHGNVQTDNRSRPAPAGEVIPVNTALQGDASERNASTLRDTSRPAIMMSLAHESTQLS